MRACTKVQKDRSPRRGNIGFIKHVKHPGARRGTHRAATREQTSIGSGIERARHFGNGRKEEAVMGGGKRKKRRRRRRRKIENRTESRFYLSGRSATPQQKKRCAQPD